MVDIIARDLECIPMNLNVKELKVYSAGDFPAYLPKLSLLYDELFNGGKGFRARLVHMVSLPIGLEASAEQLLGQTIEFIHNASLLHDDLVDRSHLRRGKTSAWLKYSPEYAVLAGDYLLARVMVNLSGFGNIQLVQYTAQIISDLLEGEWLQDSIIGDFFIRPEQLDQIHNLKTASLFKWCLRAPFIAQNRDQNELHRVLEDLGIILGQLFQRSDDLLDFNVRNYEGKVFLGDLKSGYLNSFGAYICQGLDRKKIDILIKSQSLEEFVAGLGGATEFQKYLHSFDGVNSKMIALYQHELENLTHLIKPSERGLLEQLRPLTDLIYWRRKPE